MRLLPHTSNGRRHKVTGLMTANLTIATDSREQKPHHFYDGKKHCSTLVKYTEAALDTFDYCVEGDWMPTDTPTLVRPNFAIERKSIADFIGSWFNKDNRKRELEKIERARNWQRELGLPVVYVLDGGWTEIADYDYNRFPSGQVTAKVVAAMVDDLTYENVLIRLSQSRQHAEYQIVSLLKRRARDIKARERAKA